MIEPYAYVDYNILDDRIGSSAQTDHRRDFRRDVIERDGPFCVITHEPAMDSDACHIIPRSKGHEVSCCMQDFYMRSLNNPPLTGSTFVRSFNVVEVAMVVSLILKSTALIRLRMG